METHSVKKMEMLSNDPLLNGPLDASDILSVEQGKEALKALRKLLRTVFGETQERGQGAGPLNDVSPRHALTLLQNQEDEEHFVVEQLEKKERGGLLEHLAEVADAVEGGAVVHAESVAERGFKELTGSQDHLVVESLGRNVVSLLLNDNGLQHVSVHSAYLRSLVLAGNPLTEGISGSALPRLVHLDLSFTSVGPLVQAGTLDIKVLPSLMSLSLECVDLESIADAFFEGSRIVCLSLADNEDLEVVDALDVLERTLEELDLSETPFEKKWQRTAIMQKFPNLRMFNGAATRVDGLGKLKVEGSLTDTDNVMDQNEFREGCSCLFGNPCADSYQCKDWANRFKIAKIARKRLGMEEVQGLG